MMTAMQTGGSSAAGSEITAIFDGWHSACRDAYDRAAAPCPGGNFIDSGFEYMPLLEADDAQRLASLVRRLGGKSDARHWINPYQRAVVADDAGIAFVRSLLNRVIADPLCAQLTDYFASEFLVYWFALTETFDRPMTGPADTAPDWGRPVVSYWHTDRGVGPLVSLLIYANGTESHGATTEFVDCRSTESIRRAGFPQPELEATVGPPHRIAAQSGVEWSPHSRPFAAGDGVLFRATETLHRLVLPSHGRRYALQLYFIPSPLPWRDSLDVWIPHQPAAGGSSWPLDFIARFQSAGLGPFSVRGEGP